MSELACTIRVPRRSAENLIAESRALADLLPTTWADRARQPRAPVPEPTPF